MCVCVHAYTFDIIHYIILCMFFRVGGDFAGGGGNPRGYPTPLYQTLIGIRKIVGPKKSLSGV